MSLDDFALPMELLRSSFYLPPDCVAEPPMIVHVQHHSNAVIVLVQYVCVHYSSDNHVRMRSITQGITMGSVNCFYTA